jgi:alpha-galactosidase
MEIIRFGGFGRLTTGGFGLLYLFLFAAFLFPALCSAGEVAEKPPMGWNSYDCFSYAVTEQQVKENADYMAAKMKQFGWEYIVVDYVWSCPLGKPDFVPQQDNNFNPRLNMDKYGRLLPDPNRFPSSRDGKGFKPLADYVHSKGLKFGIHLMRGIPRQAVAEKCPILGTNTAADDAANKKSECTWLNHMYGLDMKKPEAQQYLDSIFQLYAEWGVDFVKVDDLGTPYYKADEIAGYRKAIDKCGRAMVFSTSPGPTPIENADHIQKNANMWRLLDDLWDNYGQLDAAFDKCFLWYKHAGPGHWPDPDMLPLGKLRKFGPTTGRPDSYSKFTKDEQYTLMSLWCIARCPLMFGGNLPDNDEGTIELITNADVLAVNQDSINNKPLYHGPYPVWVSDVPDSKDKYIAVFNRNPKSPKTIKVRLSDLGVKKCRVKDLWSHKEIGEFTGQFTPQINPHGSGLYRIIVIEETPQTEPAPAAPQKFEGTTYEAESPDNQFRGRAAAERDIAGGLCSSGSMVKYIGDRPQNGIIFKNINVTKDGSYKMIVCYMAGADRKAYVKVNDGQPDYYDFEWTGGWNGFYLGSKEIKIQLKAGSNTIEFGNGRGGAPNLDRIIIGDKI